MTDAKDPLEELKAVKDVYVETCTSCMANRPLIVAAIAAWEKERASKACYYCGNDVERHRALRAAVEKVRDETAKSLYEGPSVEDAARWHDALDAALRGGE